MLADLLLAVVLLVAIIVIPLGLPGTWLMVGIAAAYDPVTGTHRITTVTIVVMLVLAAAGEIVDILLGGRYARRYGGSRRAGWGAVLGGIIGAVVGLPVPLIGSVLGAFAGSFIGALAAESTRGTESRAAMRVATGALIGRIAAAAAKVGIGCGMAVWLLVAVVR